MDAACSLIACPVDDVVLEVWAWASIGSAAKAAVSIRIFFIV